MLVIFYLYTQTYTQFYVIYIYIYIYIYYKTVSFTNKVLDIIYNRAI